jgi:hypothetical protein
MKQRTTWVALTLLILLLGAPAATAAELISQTIYRVPEGTTISHDLYITASEVYINGTVEGDLIVAASYVEINGTVTGDVLLAAVGAKISGDIQDTARMAVGGLEITGRIGGDLALLTSGGTTFAVPLSIAQQQVVQGLTLHPEGSIGGDLLLSAGTAVLGGPIGGGLQGTATVLTLASTIGGDTAVQTTLLTLEPTARIAGTFAYTAPQASDIAATAASDIQYTPLISEEDVAGALGQTLLTLIGTITGFALLGWALLHYAPGLLFVPLQTVARYPIQSAWSGFMVGLLFLIFPLATFLLAFGASLFWGMFSAVILALFIVTSLGMVWLVSPLIIALWVGFRFNAHPLTALIIGLFILIPLLQFPLLGGLLSPLCFFLVLGSLLHLRRAEPAPE